MRAGQEIVLTKWVGLSGTLRIVAEKESELKMRFTDRFLRQITDCRKNLFVLKELEIAGAMKAAGIYEVGEGGIFAALWRLAGEAKTGLSVDIKRISIRQETIEICEYYRLNPYQLASFGSFLIVVEKAEPLIHALREQGIYAQVIGSLTDNNDKILKNGEDIRYIDRPAPDEIDKILLRK